MERVRREKKGTGFPSEPARLHGRVGFRRGPGVDPRSVAHEGTIYGGKPPHPLTNPGSVENEFEFTSSRALLARSAREDTSLRVICDYNARLSQLRKKRLLRK